jgi:hypothetical protein
MSDASDLPGALSAAHPYRDDMSGAVSADHPQRDYLPGAMSTADAERAQLSDHATFHMQRSKLSHHS